LPSLAYPGKMGILIHLQVDALVERSCEGSGEEKGFPVPRIVEGNMTADDDFEVVGIGGPGNIGAAIYFRDLAGNIEQRLKCVDEIDLGTDQMITFQESVYRNCMCGDFLRRKIQRETDRAIREIVHVQWFHISSNLLNNLFYSKTYARETVGRIKIML
jgi:hypothetical protein